MRIGLVRHLPVVEALPRGWKSADDLHRWRERYELADLQPFEPRPKLEGWQVCYSSDLQRCMRTAVALYPGEVRPTPLLREADLARFRTGKLTLPVSVWKWVLRAAWLTGHSSQREARNEFLHRVNSAIELLTKVESDVLVVSHAGMMAFLRKSLLQKGFRGPKFRVAEHARLYVFERP